MLRKKTINYNKVSHGGVYVSALAVIIPLAFKYFNVEITEKETMDLASSIMVVVGALIATFGNTKIDTVNK